MSKPALISLEHSDDVCVLRLTGRLETGADMEHLRAKSDEIRAHACKKLLADFREVPFIGSTGIGFLVTIYTTVTKTIHGAFVLVGAAPRVREVLDLTCLSRVIPMAPDIESGLRMLRNRAVE